MNALQWLILFALSGPILGIGFVVAERYFGGRPLTSRRFIVGGAIGGALTLGFSGCLIEIVPEHVPFAFPVGLIAGVAFGAHVGALVVLMRRVLRHRDHT